MYIKDFKLLIIIIPFIDTTKHGVTILFGQCSLYIGLLRLAVSPGEK
jgi:hypothetical protein